MLLSQKLLANPKMITIDQEDLLDKSEANAIRAFFLTYLKRATKYVVPTSIFDGDFAITETEVSRDYSKFPDQLRSIIEKHGSNRERFEAEMEKLETMYKTYARPPHPTMTIENDSGIILLTPNLYKEGVDIFFYCAKTSFLFSSNVYFIPGTGTLTIALMVDPHRRTSDANRVLMEKIMDGIGFSLYAIALNALMVINAKNVKRYTVKPAARLLAKLPKTERKSHVYHILDLYRELDNAETVGFAEAEAIGKRRTFTSERALTKMHGVRGHFKQTKNGLFWWSSFIRCRRNRDTVGVVDKDYRVKSV